MTRLLNCDEEIPSEFYIFVSTLNPITAHNLWVSKSFFSGAFSSLEFSGIREKYINGTIKYLPYAPCKMDEIAISPYCITAINDYRIEYDVETCRERNYSKYPSRLSAVYAFGDYKTCEIVSRKYGWELNTVKRFKLLNHPLNRVVKVNMEHVSLARHAYKVSMINTEGIEHIWRQYWSGRGNIQMELPAEDFSRKVYESGLIWEYLIEGRVHLIE